MDAAQMTVGPQSAFFIGAATGKSPYQILPPPDTNGAPQAQSTTAPPFTSVATVAAVEPALEPQEQVKLTTGATGLPPKGVDTRVPNSTTLPNGPFQLSGPILDDDDYTGDTTHRFYQNWQQFDCTVLNASRGDPSGCLKDLYPYVITTFSTADNGVGNSMAFFNVNDDDATFLRALADQYTMSDNFHQSFMGGTAANHVMLGHADDIFWSDGKGHPIPLPANVAAANPNPKPNTNNNYTVDGNWSNCSDTTQPGVAPIVNYLKTLPYEASPNCAPGAFYMLNNVNPGFAPNGALAGGTTVPPSSVRSIGDALIDKNISWVYYGGAYNAAVRLANINPGNLAAAAALDPADAVGVAYCQICNPFQYDSSIMANPAVWTAHVKDVTDLFAALQTGSLPSVSFVKPDGLLDGASGELQGRSVRGDGEGCVGSPRRQPEAAGRDGGHHHLRRGRRLL
jgi:phospholipase C